MDATEVGAGSALLEVTEAVKQSGTYDVWSGPGKEEGVEVVAGNAAGRKVEVKVCVLPVSGIPMEFVTGIGIP